MEETMTKENADINETFELSLNDRLVKIDHHCKKMFKDQGKDALEGLKDIITGELKADKKDGFIPYDNFECSIKWEVV
jgi:hypothetical protein